MTFFISRWPEYQGFKLIDFAKTGYPHTRQMVLSIWGNQWVWYMPGIQVWTFRIWTPTNKLPKWSIEVKQAILGCSEMLQHTLNTKNISPTQLIILSPTWYPNLPMSALISTPQNGKTVATSQGPNMTQWAPPDRPGAKFGAGGHAAGSFLWLHAGWTFVAGQQFHPMVVGMFPPGMVTPKTMGFNTQLV